MFLLKKCQELFQKFLTFAQQKCWYTRFYCVLEDKRFKKNNNFVTLNNWALIVYHTYLAIRQGFPLSRMNTDNYISPMEFCWKKQVLPFLNNPKDLDKSYRMDLDFWDHSGMKKICLINKEI